MPRRRLIAALFALGAVAALMAAFSAARRGAGNGPQAATAASTRSPAAQPDLRAETPFVVQSAEIMSTTVAQRTQLSTVVALVTVTEVQDGRWNTTNGAAPPGSFNPDDAGSMACRPTVLRIDRAHKAGNPAPAGLVTVELGAAINGLKVDFAPPYGFVPRQEGIVFMSDLARMVQPFQLFITDLAESRTNQSGILHVPKMVRDYYTFDGQGGATGHAFGDHTTVNDLIPEIQAATQA